MEHFIIDCAIGLLIGFGIIAFVFISVWALIKWSEYDAKKIKEEMDADFKRTGKIQIFL